MKKVDSMYTITLALSTAFLVTAPALARELPVVLTDTMPAQRLELRPKVIKAETQRMVETYVTSDRYDRTELIEQ